MPFLGVLPKRRYLFNPSPACDVGVNDSQAWRLNPAHRHVYNKLHVALSQGLNAAPAGVNPLQMGLSANDACFVKPITNLGGMSLNSAATTAGAIAEASIHGPENTQQNLAAGSFWCEFLKGTQTSTDILVHNGKPVWFGHTQAAADKNKNRPVYWLIGADCQDTEPYIETFIGRELAGYTGLCNVEMIGRYIIEVHLRGSNAFFDFYPDDFMQRWVTLLDQQVWHGLSPLGKGCVYSMFGDWALPEDAEAQVADASVRLFRDDVVADRVGILFAESPAQAKAIEQRLQSGSGAVTDC